MGDGQGSFKEENSKWAQEVLLVATAKDISCQNPKGKPVQSPEY